MSLKHKLTLILATALILLMAVATPATRRVAEGTAELELGDHLNVAALEIQESLQREYNRRGYLNADNTQAILKQAMSGHLFLSSVNLTLWDRIIVWSTTTRRTPAGIFADSGDKAAAQVSDKYFYQPHEFTLGSGRIVRLLLAAPRAETDQVAMRLANRFLFFVGSALILLLFIIYSLTHILITAPLNELRQLTRRVTDGDLSATPSTHLSQRSDELGELSSQFQAMLTALRQASDENHTLINTIQGFNRQLEARVEAATQDLAERSAALTQARAELSQRERLAALGQLAGNIAHEIGTPLSTLSGYLQLVLADPSLPTEARDALQVSAGEAARMTRIIRRFLDSTRGLRPVPESFNLRELVENVLELSAPPGREPRQNVVLELPPDVEQCVSDPGLLRQVLINLVNNAFDAMGGDGKLTFRAEREDRDVVLEVEDEGPGVPEASRDDIFTPFYTTKAPGHGTGLGLSICREILRALRGSLTVTEARSGKGARFVVRFQAFTDG